jgi:uncharacterized protein
MNPRLLALDAAILPLVDLPPDPTSSAAVPRSAFAELGTLAGAAVGVWEMDAGVAQDIEVAEIFVVLSGRARIDFASGEQLDLEPGAMVRLEAGEHTTWTVHERLRKVYFSVG